MKNNKPLIITLIVLLSIIVIALIVGFVFLLSGKANFKTRIMNFSFGNKVSENLVYEKNIPYTHDLNNIKINVDMGDVEVIESNDSTIRVEIYSDKSSYDVDDGNSLNINVENKTCHFFCFNVKKDKVIVYLPTNYENNIDIKNSYGDIKVGTFNDATLKIEEDCGDVVVESVKNATIENSYGDIKVNNAVSLDIDEDCGNVEVFQVVNAIIKNSFGDIKIDTVLDGKVKIENNCGDIEIKNLNLISDSTITNDFGNIEIGDTNELYIEAKTDLGDVDVKESVRDAAVTLTIKNDCGDIEVRN